MSNIIDLDAERAKRGKLRGLTQVEHIIVRHDGYLAPCVHNTMVATGHAWECADCGYVYGRATDCGEEMLRHAELLRRMAEFGDYPNG